MGIKNVVFDLGNVLLDFRPEEFLKQKFTDNNMVKRLYSTVFASQEWIKLDKGTITEQEAVDIFIEREPDLEEGIRLIFSSWEELLKPIKETVEILRLIAALGIPLYVLSNFHLRAYQVVRNYVFFRHFKGLIISAEENTIKPEPEIYQLLLERYCLIPEETIFIDDTLQNLEGAQNFGIKIIHFTGASELRKNLKGIGLI